MHDTQLSRANCGQLLAREIAPATEPHKSLDLESHSLVRLVRYPSRISNLPDLPRPYADHWPTPAATELESVAPADANAMHT